MNKPTHVAINAWADDDKPREKMLSKGRGALSNAELLAILLGNGTRNKSAVELGKEILLTSNNDIAALGRLSENDLMRIKGVGPAKAAVISAALELGRRRRSVESGMSERL